MEQDVLSDAVREFTILIKNNEDVEAIEESDASSDEETSTEDIFKIGFQRISIRDFKLRVFDEIIDVRTPEEFSRDRIHGSINIPALTNDQRETIASSALETDIKRVTTSGFIWESTIFQIVNLCKDICSIFFIEKKYFYKCKIGCFL